MNCHFRLRSHRWREVERRTEDRAVAIRQELIAPGLVPIPTLEGRPKVTEECESCGAVRRFYEDCP